MSKSRVCIYGGSVVTPFGVHDATLWIRDGKIERVGQDTLKKAYATAGGRPDCVDASDYYILPGFLATSYLQPVRRKGVTAYIEEVRNLIASGVTSIIDTIQLDTWMTGSQVAYQLANHYNNLIDYCVRIRLQAAHLTPARLAELFAYKIHQIEVRVGHREEIGQLDWEHLARQLSTYKVSLILHIEDEQSLEQEYRQAMYAEWIHRCLQAKIRTSIHGIDPFSLKGQDAFYLLAEADGKECERGITYLSKHWYEYLPMVCDVRQMTLRQLRKAQHGEQALSLLVRLAVTNTAKAAGCYPQKGSLLPGADADLVLLHKDEWLTNFELSTMLKFSELCLPRLVMSKGKWIYKEANHLSTVGAGRRLQQLQPYNYVI